jgi:hypothetical protein
MDGFLSGRTHVCGFVVIILLFLCIQGGAEDFTRMVYYTLLQENVEIQENVERYILQKMCPMLSVIQYKPNNK